MLVRIKKTVYVLAFTFLGILLSTLIRAGIEHPLLTLIVEGDSIRDLSWETWKMIHTIGGLLLLVAGIDFGAQQGFSS